MIQKIEDVAFSDLVVKFDVGSWGSRTKVVDQWSLHRETLLYISWSLNAKG